MEVYEHENKFNISIVTFTNNINELQSCLDSIDRQDAHVEIIVIDNLGSPNVKALLDTLNQL